MSIEFKPWPKIPRPNKLFITITEKMDGTNACIIIENNEVVGVQSRNRLIKVGDDNMGFASWVDGNSKELSQLGDGYHYGEWCGPKVQNNPHKLKEKSFFLFNTFRTQETLPECVRVVKTLYHGLFSEKIIDEAYTNLWASAEEMGYVPEGIVVYHHNSKQLVKYTYANQDGKWVDNG